MSRYLVKARNRAESTEQSRFPPPRVDFCSIGSPRACRVFEWAIAQPIVRDDPWHHIDQLCIRALTSARAFAAATCRAGPRARRRRTPNILTARKPMGRSTRRRLRTSLLVDPWLEITKLCTEVNISILKQNKSTLWVLEEEISRTGISTIGKWEFTILQNGMVLYTCKDSILSPECLAYWSRWLDVSP